MEKKRLVKNLEEVVAYRLTQPEGHSRTVALLVDKDADGAQNLSVGICIVDPNSQTPLHEHQKEEEAMFILKGKAKIQDNEYELREASIIFCPPRTSHQIINTSNQELEFLFIYGPGGPELTVKALGKPTKPIQF